MVALPAALLAVAPPVEPGPALGEPQAAHDSATQSSSHFDLAMGRTPGAVIGIAVFTLSVPTSQRDQLKKSISAR